jgi:hypothetical protein
MEILEAQFSQSFSSPVEYGFVASSAMRDANKSER